MTKTKIIITLSQLNFVVSLVYAGRSQEDTTICIPSYNIFLVPISNILLSCMVTANFCNNISPTILDNTSQQR